MHEKTRLLLCRAGFVLLCVLPTLATIGAVAYLRSDAYLTARREDWQESLSRRLGVSVEIDRVSYPEMNVAVLQGVRLKCPETGQKLASAFAVEVAWRDGEWEVELNQPEIDAAHVARLQRTLLDQVVTRLPREFPSVYVWSDQTSFAGRATLHEFEAIVESASDGPKVEAVFKVVGVDMNEPARFSLRRKRGPKGAKSAWTFATHGAPLPCDVVALFAPEWETLGPDARIQGDVKGNWSDQVCDWSFKGKLDHVALDRWPWGERATGQLGAPNRRQAIVGLADVDVKRFESNGGRLTALDVSIRSSTTGWLGRDVVERAASSLGLVASDLPKKKDGSPVERVAFDRLAIDLQLKSTKLTMHGAVENAPGVFARSSTTREPILREPEPRPLPAIALAHFLSPPTRDMVPATVESGAWLKRLLPAEGNEVRRAAHDAGAAPKR